MKTTTLLDEITDLNECLKHIFKVFQYIIKSNDDFYEKCLGLDSFSLEAMEHQLRHKVSVCTNDKDKEKLLNQMSKIIHPRKHYKDILKNHGKMQEMEAFQNTSSLFIIFSTHFGITAA